MNRESAPHEGLPPMSPSHYGRTEEVWAICIASALTLFFLTLALSFFLGGYAVIRAHGEFLLIRGRARREVDQTVGLLFFATSWAFLLAFLGSVAMSLAVYVRRGTLRVGEVFQGERGVKVSSRLFLLGALLSLLPLLALVLRAIL